MNREHIRGFFNQQPIPGHRAFHDWMAGANARLWFWLICYHLAISGIGFILGRLTT